MNEAQKKHDGMELSALANSEKLEYARAIAEWIAETRDDRTCSSDDVRMYLERNNISLGSGNWWGSLFKYDGWVATDRRVRASHTGSHNREVRVWRRA